MWVATVANIDWPSRSGLSADQQRAELSTILDRAAATRLNAVLLQVRTASDALYASADEPWGAMLTGTQGADPGYDPLQFAVTEAHRRGLELHAWINPFRAGNAADSARLAATHVFRTRRDLVRVYGPQLVLDPGEPEVHDRVIRAALDIVRRYDVDALHLDDYFYPYPRTDASGRTIDFPDSATHARLGAGVPRADWRRANVDRFVERLYREVHAVRPTARVGISPFGIWRPGNPAGVTGLDAWATLYADSRKWLASGWVDYLAPQLYWRIDPPQQSFTALLDWWRAQNDAGRHVWPGIATYRVYEATNPFPLEEITRQARATRERGGDGMLFYNATTTLARDGGRVASALSADVFTDIAVPPAATWLDAVPPDRPVLASVAASRGSWTARVSTASTDARWWLVRYRAGTRWTTRLLRATEGTVTLADPDGRAIDWVVVNAVDAAGNLGADAAWRAAP